MSLRVGVGVVVGGFRDTVFPLGIETRATETSVYLHTSVLEGRGRW